MQAYSVATRVQASFFGDPDQKIIWIQPAHWSRCCVLGQDASQWLSVLSGFEQAANSVVTNSEKSAGALDRRKLLSIVLGKLMKNVNFVKS